MNYRKIWEDHYGPIPKDENGRSYEIHHKDGNHKNNDVYNLHCCSIQEHYDIHYIQGDWIACASMWKRMRLSPAERSKLQSLAQRKLVKEGTHHLLGSNHNNKMIMEGKNAFANGKAGKISNKKRLQNGTHHLLGGKFQKNQNNKRVKNGTHHFLTLTKIRIENGTHPSIQIHKCPYCGKIGKGGVMFRYHFERCKLK